MPYSRLISVATLPAFKDKTASSAGLASYRQSVCETAPAFRSAAGRATAWPLPTPHGVVDQRFVMDDIGPLPARDAKKGLHLIVLAGGWL